MKNQNSHNHTIIEHLVRREIRKQLPVIIKEALTTTTSNTKQSIVEEIEEVETHMKWRWFQVINAECFGSYTSYSTGTHQLCNRLLIFYERSKDKRDINQQNWFNATWTIGRISGISRRISPTLSYSGIRSIKCGYSNARDAPFTKNMPVWRIFNGSISNTCIVEGQVVHMLRWQKYRKEYQC